MGKKGYFPGRPKKGVKNKTPKWTLRIKAFGNKYSFRMPRDLGTIPVPLWQLALNATFQKD